jgi:hypothetical protein
VIFLTTNLWSTRFPEHCLRKFTATRHQGERIAVGWIKSAMIALGQQRLLEGLVGHLLGAVIITGGLGTVIFSIFGPASDTHTTTVCMSKLGPLVNNSDANICVRKVKQGAGPAGPGEPYWESDIPMIAKTPLSLALILHIRREEEFSSKSS